MKTDLIQKAIVRAGFSNAKVTELHQLDLLNVMYHLIDISQEQLELTAVGCPKGLQLKPLSEDMAKTLEELSQSKVGNKPNKNRF